jgi:hypothetical protein
MWPDCDASLRAHFSTYLRTEKVMAIDNGSQLNLFGKVAYARDEISDPNLTANFTALGAAGTPLHRLWVEAISRCRRRVSSGGWPAVFHSC